MDVSRICADLVAINSENPPGRTDEVIEYIREYLDRLGIKSTISGSDGRCNLVTKGTVRSLVLCGHVDVVPAQAEGWTHPPFSGAVEAGYVWGRGATDMKGGCAPPSSPPVNRWPVPMMFFLQRLLLSAMKKPAGTTGSAGCWTGT